MSDWQSDDDRKVIDKVRELVWKPGIPGREGIPAESVEGWLVAALLAVYGKAQAEIYRRDDAAEAIARDFNALHEAALQSMAVCRKLFLIAISEWSEENYAASWYSGVEQIIRDRHNTAEWCAIALAAGGWPQGVDGENGWLPLTPAEIDRAQAQASS